MPTRECPGCKVGLEIPSGTPAGKKIRCPECDETFFLPGPKPAKALSNKLKAPATQEPIEILEVLDEDEKPRPPKKKPIQVMEVIEDDEDDKPRPKKKPTRVTEVIDDEEPRPKRKKKKKTKVQNVPFWKTKMGMVLNGLGLIGLGGAGIAIAYFGEPRKKIALYIAGAVCIICGIGAIGSGMMGLTDDSGNGDEE